MTTVAEAPGSTLLFTYGTLKRGFSNHPLLENLIASGDVAFVAYGVTAKALPLVCGPFRVPFLINNPGHGHRVSGEVYSVSSAALARIDELEGLSRGHYERLPIEIQIEEETPSGWAYFAHRSYGEALWRRSGDQVYDCYSEKLATGYVKRNDRPKNLSFMDQVRVFIAS